MRIVPGSIVGIAADKKHGMTLGELAAFVQAAYKEDAPTDAIVECKATWRNSIRELSVLQGEPRELDMPSEQA
jgi:uncharacterized protein YbbC (DUF1343 family)